MSSGGYADEYPFELQNGKLVALENLETIRRALKQELTKATRKKVEYSMSSKYGATFINGKEYILFGYCYGDDLESCTGYQSQLLVAYDPHQGIAYYTSGNFGGEKTMVTNTMWYQLGSSSANTNNNRNNNTQKVTRGALTLINNSDNPYTVSSVNGDIVMKGHTETTLYFGYNTIYRLTVKQNSGFMFYPIVLYYDVQFNEQLTERTIKFPFN